MILNKAVVDLFIVQLDFILPGHLESKLLILKHIFFFIQL